MPLGCSKNRLCGKVFERLCSDWHGRQGYQEEEEIRNVASRIAARTNLSMVLVSIQLFLCGPTWSWLLLIGGRALIFCTCNCAIFCKPINCINGRFWRFISYYALCCGASGACSTFRAKGCGLAPRRTATFHSVSSQKEAVFACLAADIKPETFTATFTAFHSGELSQYCIL